MDCPEDQGAAPNHGVRSSVRAFRVLVWRMLGAVLAFGSTVVVTRVFGPGTAGIYFLAVAVSSIAITISRLGLDLPTMRLVTTADKAPVTLDQRLVLSVAARLTGIVALGSTAILLASASILATVFGEPALGPMIRLTSLGTIPAVLSVLYARGLIGVGRPEIAEFGQRAGFHIAFVIMLAVLVPATRDLALGAAFSLAHAAMLAILFVMWITSTRGVSRPANTPALRSELTASGLPLLIAATMNLVVAWSDTLMLGYFLDPAAVGVYSAAIRVASVVSFVLVASGSIAGPRFARLLACSDRTTLERVFRTASKGSGLAAMAIAIPLFIFAPQILGLFGKSFPAGTAALRLLIAAQLFHSAAGLVGILLAMAKRERRVLSSTAAAAGLNILLNVLLIPRLGIFGAAISTMVALVTLNAINTLWVFRDLGLSIFTRKT